MGDGIIIGVLDTGIWPESEAFNDKGLGPIPSKWKGHCQSGTDFDPAKACNKKLIGAKYFLKGFEAELGRQFLKNEFVSPRDGKAHTHQAPWLDPLHQMQVAMDLLMGELGVVCWDSGVCNSADIIKGIDEAINDGVDVLSISIGLTTPQYADVDMRNGIAFVSYHAVGRGITVICSGGNEGPISQTVDDTSPWIITVAASSIDRSFPTFITLGNNTTFVGQSLYTERRLILSTLFIQKENGIYCDKLNANDTWAAGNVVLCFLVQGDDLPLSTTQEVLQEVGGLGLIVAKNPTTDLNIYASDFPSIGVSFDVGAQLLDYIRYARKPQVKFSAPKTHVGIPVSTHIASFSSRGPNCVAPAILKSLHQHCSPAAIKSALVTTAWQTDPHSGEPIIAKGNTDKIVDPFDFGGGLVNANGTNDPGLVYEMGESDYVFNYLCPMGYNTSAISRITNRFVTCANKMPSILDFNLPSLTIPSLKKTVTVKRTVTNVGPVNSQYKAIIEPPLGITIKVMPETLIFNSSIEKISFTLTISTTHKYNTGYNFGRLRSPISVKTEFPELAG
ncbi:hypothetical protein H5410_017191 [Solanum commersonii]|uniref:Uncharacterized protein n=1 Tax=Solanum commersonii TaxID=4109 RepID=A0A9J5ZZT9_SOLCO|nr:hypothetical protein H5410_017191 [Solanum commersonii]